MKDIEIFERTRCYNLKMNNQMWRTSSISGRARKRKKAYLQITYQYQYASKNTVKDKQNVRLNFMHISYSGRGVRPIKLTIIRNESLGGGEEGGPPPPHAASGITAWTT